MKIARCTLAALGAALLATGALAQGPATKVSKDSNTPQATFPLAGQNDASGAFHYRNISEGLQADGKTPQAWYVDANGLGHISVDASILPAGAATSSGQTTANGFLGQIAGAVSGTNINVNCTSGCSGSSSGGSVVVLSSALPAGAATAAGQANIINALTPTGGLPTAPSNAAQAHTDAAAIASALAPSGGLPTSEKNSAAIAASEASTATNTGAVAANQLGTANFAPSQASVTASATSLVTARATRRSITLYNTGSSTVFLGGSGVTTTTGFPLPGGATLTLTYAGALYGITASGSSAVSEYEVF